MKKNFLWIYLFLISVTSAQQQSAIDVVKSVADKVISETAFEFDLVEQEPVLEVQIIDFEKEYGSSTEGTAYALSYIHSDYDTLAQLGISAGDAITIWLNDAEIKFKKSASPSIKEIAYGMVNFDDTVEVNIKKGINKILVRSETPLSKIFIRQIIDNPEAAGWLKFSASPTLAGNQTGAWLLSGLFENNGGNVPEKEIKNFYFNNNSYINWRLPEVNTLSELKINKDNIFKKDSYADWNYANGETMLSFLTLAEASGDWKYKDFVVKWCEFIIDNIPYFRHQYDSLNALRGSFHRIFRKSMLDDAGAPVLPFASLSLTEDDKKYQDLFSEMTDYVINDQVRLKDGTFCRPEPVEMTVWADDLFMSVPLLLRMGMFSDDQKYFDDAANQILKFNKLLYNSDAGLYKHGWFSAANKTSAAFWGRANGWVMWALTEALMLLPESHKNYNDILSIYRDHINGLIKYQDESGMWHQVLDHPESYEESSCTAMFILGIARGVNNGWLDESYKTYALKGWNALADKIEDGVVHGICRGTGIGNDLEFYFNRPTFDNDPRGLGAVITAGVEIYKMK